MKHFASRQNCIRAVSNPVIPTSMNEKPFEISTFQRVFDAVCSMGKCVILLDFMGDFCAKVVKK